MKKSTAFIVHLFLIGVFGILIPNQLNAQIENWPQFRGMNGSGIAAADQDPPINFGPDKNVLWKTSLPSSYSSPCIWGDCIFITGIEEEGKLLKLFCIDRNDGTIRWEKAIEVEEFERIHVLGNPATATPSTDGEKVYFYFGSYGLLCYDLNGEKQWDLPMPMPKSRHEMGTSPVISGDLLILNCFSDQNDPRLLAINKYDGSMVWKHTLEKLKNRDSYATPVINNDEVIIYASDYVSGYDISTGNAGNTRLQYTHYVFHGMVGFE